MADLATNNNSNLVKANASDFQIPRGYICTLDITTIAGKVQLAKALNGAISVADKINVPLRVTDVVTTQGVRSRTGEECVNTYLITEDGTVYFSQSDGIARSVKILVGIFTDANSNTFINPVEAGIAFMIQEQKMANGNTLKTVIPVELPTNE